MTGVVQWADTADGEYPGEIESHKGGRWEPRRSPTAPAGSIRGTKRVALLTGAFHMGNPLHFSYPQTSGYTLMGPTRRLSLDFPTPTITRWDVSLD